MVFFFLDLLVFLMIYSFFLYWIKYIINLDFMIKVVFFLSLDNGKKKIEILVLI